MINAPPNSPAEGFQLTEMLRSALAVAVAEILGSASALDTTTSARAPTVRAAAESFRTVRINPRAFPSLPARSWQGRQELSTNDWPGPNRPSVTKAVR